MNGDDRPNSLQARGLSQLPQTFAQTIAYVEAFALQRLREEVIQKKLYYHTEDHVKGVRRRSHQILDTLYNTSEAEATTHTTPLDLDRTGLLLDLCAAAHDMVQLFEQNTQKNTARRRLPGRSEAATLGQLMPYIQQINRLIKQHDPNSTATFTDADIAVIQEAINATICIYVPLENAIHQPLLHSPDHVPSTVAQILALADLGALGMDGVEAYSQEGSLLFLEENPDVVPFLRDGTIHQLEVKDPAIAENIRQRLLKRARFQVSFAKSRLARFKQELQGFPKDVIPVLIEKIFRYLTPTTIQVIEATTPTQDKTDLNSLLKFFRLENYLT
ncbi:MULTISPECIES: hypothetical protein [unclassified Leptolyngbya]|uniref:hypothetical protein n=1 Tax=unclassified Leptolyngbya TaxID=2650499 RepID=UPI0016845F04|nr:MULTISPECIES: hypothetical protein [unclassified Leptolyngbya]MBD1911099.1 hypothetical protein [Leptolyngbya sp. FACHB-8]MBD2157081.1 hypothetical protein [Leptolyngbya sp. FACHB-16]